MAKLTEDAVTWHIVPSAVEPFTVFLSTHDKRLVVLLGFTGGVEYQPIWVMRQFSFQHDAVVDSTALELLRPYSLNSTATTTELAHLMHHGIQSIDIAAVIASGCISEYVTEVQGF